MELIYDILNKLHIDKTFYTQFGLVIVLFFGVKALLMSKLQEVLDMREGKTVKREAGANEKFAKAEELAEKYNQRIAEANSEAQKKFEHKRDEVNRKQQTIYEEAVSKIEKETESKRNSVLAEVDAHKSAMVGRRDELINELVEKVTQ